MSSSNEEMTATCQDLTKRAAEQAQLVRAAADDAAKILHIATALAAGSEDSVRRNTTLADLARRPKQGLDQRSEEHTSELQSQSNLVCRLLLEKKKKIVTLTSYLPTFYSVRTLLSH